MPKPTGCSRSHSHSNRRELLRHISDKHFQGASLSFLLGQCGSQLFLGLVKPRAPDCGTYTPNNQPLDTCLACAVVVDNINSTHKTASIHTSLDFLNTFVPVELENESSTGGIILESNESSTIAFGSKDSYLCNPFSCFGFSLC